MHCILLACLLVGNVVCAISAGGNRGFRRSPTLSKNEILKLSFRTHPKKRNLPAAVQGQNGSAKYLFRKARHGKVSVNRIVASKKVATKFSINTKTSKSVRQQIKDFFSKVHFKSRRAKGGSSSLSGVQTGGLPLCACKWPDLTQDGANEQVCPPPPIKCEICMGATNAIRFGSNPINYCGSDGDLYTEESDKRSFYEFCYAVGSSMEGMAFEIHGVITALTMKFGEGYGASHEICSDLRCCDEIPTHTDLPPKTPEAIRNKVSGGGAGSGDDDMNNNVEGVSEAKGADMNTNGGTHAGPGSGSRKDTFS